MISVTIQTKGRAGVTLRMEYHTHVKPASSNDTIKQMTSTWRSKINAHNIIQRNLIRHIHNNEYTIKNYIQIHNKECTEISPRDSCFVQWVLRWIMLCAFILLLQVLVICLIVSFDDAGLTWVWYSIRRVTPALPFVWIVTEIIMWLDGFQARRLCLPHSACDWQNSL